MAGKPPSSPSPRSREARKPTPGAASTAGHPVYSRDEIQQILSERESWTAGELAETIARFPPAQEGLPDRLGHSHPGHPRPGQPSPGGLTGGTSATRAGIPSPAVPRPRCTAVACGRCASSPASAPRGHERTLQVPARARDDRPLHGLRHAGAHGLRRGPPPVAGRGGQGRRRHLDAQGLRDPLRRDPARRRHHLHDHQRERGRRAGDVRGRREKQGVPRPGSRHDPGRHAEGVHRAEGVDRPAPTRGEDGGGHDRVLRQGDAALEPGLDQRLPHPGGRGDGRPEMASRSPTGSSTSRSAWTAAWTSTPSRSASPSSGTCTTTSSRRSPSSGPPGASGPGR